MTAEEFWATPGVMTNLTGADLAGAELAGAELAGLPADPVEICRVASGLVIQPHDARPLGLPEERFASNNVRPAAGLLAALRSVDPAPLGEPRDPARRVVGTCRHFTVLATALLLHSGTPARSRCGFATYFQPGKGVDHWVTEFRLAAERRWVRIDTEALALSVLPRPDDLSPGLFLTGGEAWAAFRRGEIDAGRFGVHGTENWGPGEIRANAIRDLAALNKAEPLPWDDWGRMDASYKGETGPEYDELMDTIAATTADPDPAAVAAVYTTEDLSLPADLQR